MFGGNVVGFDKCGEFNGLMRVIWLGANAFAAVLGFRIRGIKSKNEVGFGWAFGSICTHFMAKSQSKCGLFIVSVSWVRRVW